MRNGKLVLMFAVIRAVGGMELRVLLFIELTLSCIPLEGMV